MAKLSVIEARKAKALEQINLRLARIEAKLGIVDEQPAPAPAPEDPAESGQAPEALVTPEAPPSAS